MNIEEFAHIQIGIAIQLVSMTELQKRVGSKAGKGLLTLTFALVFSLLLITSASDVFAMGQAPSTCNNRYDGTITSMKITIGHRTYDPIANPGMTIKLQNTLPYIVTLTINTSNQSVQGNSLNGSTWFSTSAPGYELGQCINNAGPDQKVTITQTEVHPSNLAPSATQTVSWTTLTSNASYKIQWTNPTH